MFQKLETRNIPELDFFHTWMDENPGIFQNIINQYETLVQDTILLSDEYVRKIETARKWMKEENIKMHNASNLDTVRFFKDVQINKDELMSVFQRIFDGDDRVLNKLQSMLEGGSKIAQDISKKPKDGDPVWDRVIWGHTQINTNTSPEVLIHFVLSHYISQYMNVYLGDTYELREKDDFLNSLTDIILLKSANNEGKGIYNVWSKTKEQGGLGWIDERQGVFYK